MRILSYNIQAAVNTSSYFGYAFWWYRHIFPTPNKRKTLRDIANFIADFDVVCLQEIDLGGLRNGFHNHALQLKVLADFPYLLTQINRRIGRLSLHGNLILSKIPIQTVVNEPLPAKIPGRGVLAGQLENGLVIANVHLSLGKLDQHKQLRFIRTRLREWENVLITGDFNCQTAARPLRILHEHGYRHLGANTPTFPSWQPKKTFDHAFLKGHLAASCQVSSFSASDHLPLIIEI